jgi:hypothetical protein
MPKLDPKAFNAFNFSSSGQRGYQPVPSDIWVNSVNFNPLTYPCVIPQRSDVVEYYLNGNFPNNATSTIYTVPNNKEAYVYFTYFDTSAAVAVNCLHYASDGATLKTYHFNTNATGIIQKHAYAIPIKMSEGEMLKVYGAAGAGGAYNVLLWEQNSSGVG